MPAHASATHVTINGQRVAQQEFDLRVEAAQLVIGPALCRSQDLGVDAQRIGFLFSHQPGRRLRALMALAGDRLHAHLQGEP